MTHLKTKIPIVTFQFSREPKERYAAVVFTPTTDGGWEAVLFNGEHYVVDSWTFHRSRCRPSVALAKRLIATRIAADEA